MRVEIMGKNIRNRLKPGWKLCCSFTTAKQLSVEAWLIVLKKLNLAPSVREQYS